MAFTVMQNSGQWISHKRHSVHFVGSFTLGSPKAPVTKICLGQNSTQIPHFLHHFSLMAISTRFSLALGILSTVTHVHGESTNTFSLSRNDQGVALNTRFLSPREKNEIGLARGDWGDMA
jgi:hypothetical protein